MGEAPTVDLAAKPPRAPAQRCTRPISHGMARSRALSCLDSAGALEAPRPRPRYTRRPAPHVRHKNRPLPPTIFPEGRLLTRCPAPPPSRARVPGAIRPRPTPHTPHRRRSSATAIARRWLARPSLAWVGMGEFQPRSPHSTRPIFCFSLVRRCGERARSGKVKARARNGIRTRPHTARGPAEPDR